MVNGPAESHNLQFWLAIIFAIGTSVALYWELTHDHVNLIHELVGLAAMSLLGSYSSQLFMPCYILLNAFIYFFLFYLFFVTAIDEGRLKIVDALSTPAFYMLLLYVLLTLILPIPGFPLG